MRESLWPAQDNMQNGKSKTKSEKMRRGGCSGGKREERLVFMLFRVMIKTMRHITFHTFHTLIMSEP